MLNEDIELAPPPPAPKDVIRPLGPGSRLRRIRESKHLSLDEMAKRLRLSPERLGQIENDDYHLMGASAFARGYIRSYAGQLGMHKEEILGILKTFDELDLGAEIPTNKPQLIHEKMDQVNPRSARRLSYLLTLLLLVLVGYWFYSQATKPAVVTANADTQSSAVATTADLPSTGTLAPPPALGITQPAPPVNLTLPAAETKSPAPQKKAATSNAGTQ